RDVHLCRFAALADLSLLDLRISQLQLLQDRRAADNFSSLSLRIDPRIPHDIPDTDREVVRGARIDAGRQFELPAESHTIGLRSIEDELALHRTDDNGLVP